MILQWVPNRLNHIESGITLVPGYNEIEDETWERVKISLEHHIKVGNVKAISKEITKKITDKIKDKDGKEVIKEKTIKVDVAIDFKDLPLEKKREVVAGANNIKMLEKWRKSVPEDAEMRALIADKIKEIENTYESAKARKENKDKSGK